MELRQSADHIWAETGPMLITGHNHWDLTIAHILHACESVSVFRDIDDRIAKPLAIKRAGGCGALNTGWLAVNGNGHLGPLNSACKRGEREENGGKKTQAKPLAFPVTPPVDIHVRGRSPGSRIMVLFSLPKAPKRAQWHH
jgi:hypothetical protein